MNHIQCKQVPIDSIRPYHQNPRTDHHLKSIANSIKSFGFLQPIVIDSTGTIIVGHGRYHAARTLGMPTVPVVVADHLSEDEVRAYRIADNVTHELSIWNTNNLQHELDQLSAADWDLAALLDIPTLPFADLLNQSTKPRKLTERPPPKLAWLLVQIPIDQFHLLQRHLDELSQYPNCHAYTTVTGPLTCPENETTPTSRTNSPSDATTSPNTTRSRRRTSSTAAPAPASSGESSAQSTT